MVVSRPFLIPLPFVCCPVGFAQTSGLFDAPEVIADNRQQIVRTLDLNDDGWMDAFGWWVDGTSGANPGFGNLHGWINDRAGRLELAWQVPITFGAPGIPRERCGVADLDGDGDDDWILASSYKLRVFLSQGAAPPVLAINFHTGDVAIKAVALADIDGDGTLEIATSGSELALFDLDVGAGAITLIDTFQSNFAHFGPLVVAELTGDETPDLLLSGTRVHPIVDDAIQPYSSHYNLPGPTSARMWMHDAGDIDGDGDLDVISFYSNTYDSFDFGYRVLRRVASDTLAAEPAVAGGPARILVDVDGDGDLDGVCCGGSGAPGPSRNTRTSTFRVAFNDGSGTFATAVEWPGLGSTAIAGAVDLDHDGDLDLVAGRTVHYARGPVVAHPNPAIGAAANSARRPSDIDGDGDLDIDPGVQGSWTNRGDGTFGFEPPALPPPPPGAQRFGDGYIADWDGDGDPDLLATHGSPYHIVGLELLTNVGCGHFESAGVVAGPHGFVGISGVADGALGRDLDGDGDLDLLLRTRPDNFSVPARSAWWRNDGPGEFELHEEFDRRVEHVADLSGDGIPDLVGTGPASGGVTPLWWSAGLGGGAFGPWSAVADTDVRASLDHFALGDLDEDGDVDIVAVKWGQPPRAQLHWNDGSGGFTTELITSNIEWGHDVEHLALITDIQGDRRPDLVIGPLDDAPNALAVFLRKSDCSGFESERVYCLLEPTYGTWHTDFIARDFDGDGDKELLSHRRYDNLTFDGGAAGRRFQVDDGAPGTGGIAPLLGATGPFRFEQNAVLRLSGLRPGARGVLARSFRDSWNISAGLGLVSAPMWLALPFTATGAPGDPAGSGSWSLGFTVDMLRVGRTEVLRAVVIDPAALGGIARSNKLLLTYGP